MSKIGDTLSPYLHALGAAAMVSVGGALGYWVAIHYLSSFVLGVATVWAIQYWVRRELRQSRQKYGKVPPYKEWTKQKKKETWFPVAAAVLTSGVWLYLILDRSHNVQ